MTIRHHGVRCRDILLIRPFEHVIAVVFILTSIAGLLTPGGPFGGLLAESLAVAWSSLGAATGVAILLGMHYKGDAHVGRAIEQSGWASVLVLTWGGIWLLAWLAPEARMSSDLADDLLIGAGALLRGAFLWREGRAAKRLHAQIVSGGGVE